MNLKGEFSWIQSLRLGGRKAISFTLKCTNLLYDETFNAAILDGSGSSQPLYFTISLSPLENLLDLITILWDGIGAKETSLSF